MSDLRKPSFLRSIATRTASVVGKTVVLTAFGPQVGSTMLAGASWVKGRINAARDLANRAIDTAIAKTTGNAPASEGGAR